MESLNSNKDEVSSDGHHQSGIDNNYLDGGTEVQCTDVDGFLERIGEFGRFQIFVEALLCIAMIPQTLQILLSYFAVHNPPWRCVANSSICRFNNSIDAEDDRYKARCLMPRSEWQYTENKDYSVVTEFDLHCKTDVYIHLSTTMYFVGWAVGAIFLGWLTDRHGRKLTLFLSLFGILCFGLASAFSPDIISFTVLRFLAGLFQSGGGPQMTILISEFVGPKHRPLASTLLWFFFTIGLLLLGLKAYLVRKWRTLVILCSAPYAFILLFALYIPESVRWLHSQGRITEAMAILRRIARTNKKPFPKLELVPISPVHQSNNSCHFSLFLTSKVLMMRTVMQSLAWLVAGMVYYGLSLAADDLGGGLYQDYALSSLVEFPAAAAAVIGCNRLGRKSTVIIGLMVGSVACIAVPFIPIHASSVDTALRVSCGMIGKFFITVSFDSLYPWSFELFATVIRAEGMGIMQVMSRIGAASAPWITKWLEVIHHVLPFFIMGGSAFASAIVLFGLPETKGKATQETLDGGSKRLKVEEDIENDPLLGVD